MLAELCLGLLSIVAAPQPGRAQEHAPAEVIAVILSNHVDRAALDASQIAEALRSKGAGLPAPGVEFSTVALADEGAAAPAFRVERVEGGWVVVGVRTLGAKGVADGVREALKKAAEEEGGLQGLVLDLRFLADYLHFQEGARLASLFLPDGTRLFELRGAGGEAEVFSSKDGAVAPLPPLAVVIGQRTGGAGEAVAEALRVARRAVLIGAPTAGRAAEYSETRLSSGRYLRVPVRRVLLPGGAAVFPKRVAPDVAVQAVSTKDEAAMLKAEWRDGLADFVAEGAAAPRQNEAALVRGENPELEEAIRARIEAPAAGETNKTATAKSGKGAPAGGGDAKEEPKEAHAKDAALQRALDFLRAVDALGLNRAPAAKPPAPPAATQTNAPAGPPEKRP